MVVGFYSKGKRWEFNSGKIDYKGFFRLGLVSLSSSSRKVFFVAYGQLEAGAENSRSAKSAKKINYGVYDVDKSKASIPKEAARVGYTVSIAKTFLI